MAEIFSREPQQLAGSFTTDSAALSLGSGFGVGLITQNIGLQYQQRINRLYELGTRNVYYVVGYAEGSLSMARIVGPTVAVSAFYKKYGDACKANENTARITASSAFCRSGQGNSLSYNVSALLIMTIGITMAVPDMTINEQVQAMFVNLQIESGAAGIAPAANINNNGGLALNQLGGLQVAA